MARGRALDAGGLNNWVGAVQSRLDAGQSKEQVNAWLTEQFMGCDERKALEATDQAFRDVLGPIGRIKGGTARG